MITIKPFEVLGFHIISDVDGERFYGNKGITSFIIATSTLETIISEYTRKLPPSPFKMAETPEDYEQIRNNLKETVLTIPANQH